MLVIRNEQMAALGVAVLGRFEQRMLARLTARFPESCEALGPTGTRDLVRRAVTAGAAAGIREEAAVATFVELRMEFGEAFEASPDAADAEAILGDAHLPGQIKVVLLAECLTARTGGLPLVRDARL